MSYAALADKYRNQRDVLVRGLEDIVKEDSDGERNGYYATMALAILAAMARTTENGPPND
jgi:hypothetical protein